STGRLEPLNVPQSRSSLMRHAVFRNTWNWNTSWRSVGSWCYWAGIWSGEKFRGPNLRGIYQDKHWALGKCKWSCRIHQGSDDTGEGCHIAKLAVRESKFQTQIR